MKALSPYLFAIVFSCCLSACNDPASPASSPETTGLLAALTLSAGKITPDFSPATLEYTISVPNATSATTVTATAADPAHTTISIDGRVTGSGIASGSIELKEGTQTIPILALADAGDKMIYKVTLERKTLPNLELKSLVAGTDENNMFASGVSTPDFSPKDTEYAISLPAAYSNLTFYPTAADTTATMVVGGKPFHSGDAYVASLAMGLNTVSIVLSGELAGKTYTLSINRGRSTPFEASTDIPVAAQGSGAAGSALDVDAMKAMLSAQANANQSSIDLVFLYYAGAFHLDGPVAARAAGIANSISITSNYSTASIYDLKMVRVSAIPADQESCKLTYALGAKAASSLVVPGDMFLLRTSSGGFAIVTVASITGTDKMATAVISVALTSI